MMRNIIFWALLALSCLFQTVYAQPYNIKGDCNVLYKRNRDIFIESYYLSKAIGNKFSKETVNRFFSTELDLVALDSTLRSSFDAESACKLLKAGPYRTLKALYSKDEELDKYLRKKQVNYEDVLKYLNDTKAYHMLIAKHYNSAAQTVYSLSETQARVIIYNVICNMALNHIDVNSLHIK